MKGICILGAIVDYIDKDKVLKQEHERNLDDSLYVIKGSKEDALLKELSETGYRCIVHVDESYHPSQQQLYTQIINNNKIKYINL